MRGLCDIACKILGSQSIGPRWLGVFDQMDACADVTHKVRLVNEHGIEVKSEIRQQDTRIISEEQGGAAVEVQIVNSNEEPQR